MTPGQTFQQSFHPAAMLGRTIARVSGFLSETLGPDQINPAFHPSHAQARAALAKLSANPQPLARPLVIIGGYTDAVQIVGFVDSLLQPTVRDTPIIPVLIGGCHSFAAARQRTIQRVAEALGEHPPAVDIVGLSLGGAVAVDAMANCSGSTGDRRLTVNHLFSIGSPFTGVQLAETLQFSPFMREMHPGSPLMKKIAVASAGLDVIAYAHQRDDVVGIEHCTPPGTAVHWLADDSWFWTHIASLFDVRIIADIALRLHAKQPMSTTDDPG